MTLLTTAAVFYSIDTRACIRATGAGMAHVNGVANILDAEARR